MVRNVTPKPATASMSLDIYLLASNDDQWVVRTLSRQRRYRETAGEGIDVRVLRLTYGPVGRSLRPGGSDLRRHDGDQYQAEPSDPGQAVRRGWIGPQCPCRSDDHQRRVRSV